jgi:orotate phosphoribosyltransferase
METTLSINITELLKQTDAMLTGHFELSSGLHSSQYFQCAKLLQHPEISAKIGTALSKLFNPEEIDTVVGPALGGMIIGHETARALNKKSIFVERKDGEMSLRRGFEIKEGERVIIVEDVITTAKSALEAAKIIENLGGKVVGFGCIVDRSEGKTGLNIKSLVQISPVLYKPEDCPLCKQGSLTVKPGSRNA